MASPRDCDITQHGSEFQTKLVFSGQAKFHQGNTMRHAGNDNITRTKPSEFSPARNRIDKTGSTQKDRRTPESPETSKQTGKAPPPSLKASQSTSTFTSNGDLSNSAESRQGNHMFNVRSGEAVTQDKSTFKGTMKAKHNSRLYQGNAINEKPGPFPSSNGAPAGGISGPKFGDNITLGGSQSCKQGDSLVAKDGTRQRGGDFSGGISASGNSHSVQGNDMHFFSGGT